MAEQYVWLTWAGLFLVPWGLLYLGYARHRRAMLWASAFTAPFGLTEPIFVPEYWAPPSLFDLARRTGFDIESLVFCFGIGGVAAVLHSVVTGSRLEPLGEGHKRHPLHRHHQWAIATPFIAFPVLYLFPWNPIYPAATAMVLGAIATILCRPDLTRKAPLGGMLFLGYYWIFVEGLELLSPGYVERVWNLSDLTGVILLATPLEELVFAFAFGTYWSGVYDHFTWRQPVRAERGLRRRSGSGGSRHRPPAEDHAPVE